MNNQNKLNYDRFISAMYEQLDLQPTVFISVIRGFIGCLSLRFLYIFGFFDWHWFLEICFYIILGCTILYTIYYTWNSAPLFSGVIWCLLLGFLYIFGGDWHWFPKACYYIILGCTILYTIYYTWNSPSLFSVKVHVLVAGETFLAHKTFIQKLKLRIEHCSAENSNVILVICPVVSRIGTDMETAMSRVTGNKPVILVFMHHCHDPSHMTNTTVQPSRSNIVRVVHCAFLENTGLLECRENNEAVSEVRMMLQKYY